MTPAHTGKPQNPQTGATKRRKAIKLVAVFIQTGYIWLWGDAKIHYEDEERFPHGLVSYAEYSRGVEP